MKKMISIIIILATVFALMIPAFASAGDMEEKDMWVNCENGKRLNVRTEPRTSARRIAQLNCGTKLEVLDNPGNGWLRVTDGKHTGYVQAKFLQAKKPGKFEITERADNFTAVSPYMVSAKSVFGLSPTRPPKPFAASLPAMNCRSSRRARSGARSSTR